MSVLRFTREVYKIAKSLNRWDTRIVLSEPDVGNYASTHHRSGIIAWVFPLTEALEPSTGESRIQIGTLGVRIMFRFLTDSTDGDLCLIDKMIEEVDEIRKALSQMEWNGYSLDFLGGTLVDLNDQQVLYAEDFAADAGTLTS